MAREPAWIAIVAVSGSRISPTRTMSGSCRSTERSALAKVSPWASLTWIWEMPAMSYSTGSSTVTMFTRPVLSWLSAAYSVVVFRYRSGR
jgi:hypothetical protein